MVLFFKKDKESATQIGPENLDSSLLPRHVAIIMDGNGRWAHEKGLPRAAGHRAGVESLRVAVETCRELGISYLTVYAFSTENWKRPKEEVSVLMNLLVEYLRKELQELHKNGIKINPIGKLDALPKEARRELEIARKKTYRNDRLVLNVALNYGGRLEIVEAVQALAADVVNNKIDLKSIDENVFESYLYTRNMPDPELLIRPSGELRVSNFLLWQLAYTEFWITDIYWPDFRKPHFYKALFEFQNRDRRFGGIKDRSDA
ncbi:isoprenyl transferase [Metallumcola ferriviriculae]|uniref:Isoprenyl transferase n=1 Tax=Metallumcola ferriviriculae TaxID=3039180 RepID=A0AAU0UPX8_9FIRM|nr:isoprenyl transferase [Desulfitibacteraceae bacterium MK1]